MMRKYFLLSLFVLALTAVSLAQDTKFVYDDHGRRDPFWPLISAGGSILIYDSNVDFSDLMLEGVIYDPQGEKLAMINTKVLKLSDMIGGFLVVNIEKDRVVLRRDGQDFILRVKKEK